MVKKFLHIIFPCILLISSASAQSNSPFDSLVNVLEAKYQVHFFYDPKFTKNIEIPEINGGLQDVLKTVLEGTGLYFYIDPYKRIIISQNRNLFTAISNNFFNPNGNNAETQANTAFESSEIDDRVYIIGVRSGNGPTAIITGYIRDANNGEPLNSVSITIEGVQGGVSTDAFGFYSITVPKGKQVMKASSIGLKEISRNLEVRGNGVLNIEMKEEIRSLKTALIVAQKQSNVRGIQMGVEKLNVRAIKQIPAVLGETDILRSLQTLPGVTTVGEGTAGYNVRGGSSDQNLLLLNDMTIYNPTHLFGFFSAVDADLIRGLELFKSAIPEKFGGRISSIMDVSTKDGNAKGITSSAGIGPLTSKFNIEGPIGSEKTTFILGGRATYSNWFLKYLPDAVFDKSKIAFEDLMLNFTHEFSEKDKVFISGYISNDAFKLNQDTTYGYSNRNTRIKWRHNFSNKFYNVLSAGTDQYKYSVKGRNNPLDAFDLAFEIQQLSAKSDFKYVPNNKHEFNFGVQHVMYQLNPGSIVPGDPASLIKSKFLQKEQATESTAYLGDQFRISNKLQLQGGLRFTYYRYLGPRTTYNYQPGAPRTSSAMINIRKYDKGETIQPYNGPEIRVSARYLVSPRSSFKISYNSLRQYIHMITNTTALSPTDIWKLSDQFVKPQIGEQLSVGFYTQGGSKGGEFSIEAYYKNINHYLDYKSGARLILNDTLERDVINTIGKAYGVELLYKKTFGKLNGWISYTYLRSFLKTDDPIAGETINGGKFYPANFDKPHIASLVSNYKFTQRFSISLTSTYSTGRPVTYPVGLFYMGGSQRVLYSERNAYRIPDYFRTDFSMIVDNNHRLTQKLHASWTFGVYNLTGRANPYSVFFVVENRQVKGYQLSIFANPIPFVTLNLKFK